MSINNETMHAVWAGPSASSVRAREKQKNRILFIVGILISIFTLTSFADDTEIYVATNPAAKKRPKVLIIFDNSGSMSTKAADGETRLQTAKRVVNGLVDDNPGIDYGLAVFNQNASEDRNPRNGGRIVRGISEGQTATDRAALKDTITSLGPDTWTPLCETMYEAYLYLSGQKIKYGDDDPDGRPVRDTSVERNGSYVTPLTDCEQVYVILMTDGLPTRDVDADSLIDALPRIRAGEGNRLDELTEWLYENDIDGNDANGKQRVVTYTIGFTVDHALLKSAAKKGGGDYYTANNADQLRTAFRSAVAQILSTTATFTAPTIAVNSFNRSRSLNDVYFAMFEPDSRPRWSGNLKKLRMNASGVLVDADGNNAIDKDTGDIKTNARTFWSASADGGLVRQGGVGEILKNRNPASRNILIDSGPGGALEAFTTANANLTPDMFTAADDQEMAQIIQWARGVDVDDEAVPGDVRPWILGDPLHSKPLVINYGARTGFTAENPDTRIIFGTNAGFLHMFGGDDGNEDWSFIPKELAPLQKALRRDSPSIVHPYGIDGAPATYILDSDRDGTISGTNDKVYLYFGMRRGGNSYYALDITNPERPRMMWSVSGATPGFEHLGQSWSTPQVVNIRAHNGPVLIFGGGYDKKYDVSPVDKTNLLGRAIYIVDGTTGRLLWSASPSARSANNYSVLDMTDSIPASVHALDSDGDGFVDRLYVGDLGGNVWRVDMPGERLPGSTQAAWSVFKFAALGGASPQTDQRFFNQIDVVQTRDGTLNYDAVALGSGNRAHPNDVITKDRFYVLRDININTTNFTDGTLRVPVPITKDMLYNATSNVIQEGSTSQVVAAKTTLRVSAGWYIEFDRLGEKVLSSSITLGGSIFFASFVPNSTLSLCQPAGGTAYLFSVNLHDATAVYNWNPPKNLGDPPLTANDRSKDVGTRLPDSVTPHISDDEIRIVGIGPGDNGSGTYGTGVKLQTLGTYWYHSLD